MRDIGCDLKSCFLCKNCIPAWKEVIGLKKTTITVKKGKEVFREGDPVQGIYLVNEGSVKITKGWGDQRELILRFARSGDVFGLRGLRSDAVYPISATAIEDSKVCFVDNLLLETILNTNASVTYQLMNLYAAELQRAEKKMSDLVHRDVKARIAMALFEIAEVFGINAEGFIALPLARQDIASLAGTTYETVFKFFIELTDQQVLSTSGKSIKIEDAKRLKEFIHAK